MEQEKLIEYGEGIGAGWPAFGSWNAQEISIFLTAFIPALKTT
jgi:hypothetical protein